MNKIEKKIMELQVSILTSAVKGYNNYIQFLKRELEKEENKVSELQLRNEYLENKIEYLEEKLKEVNNV